MARFGDKLIADLRAEKKTSIRIKGAIAGCNDVDVGIGTARSRKSFGAHFDDTNDNRGVPIRLKVTNKKVCDASLECRPLSRFRQL